MINTWQACPICVNNVNSYYICDVCKGTKLISTISGKPPKQNVQYTIPYNATSTSGYIEYVKEN